MLRLTLVLIVAFTSLVAAQDPEKTASDLSGTIDGRGLPMAECDSGVLRIKLTASLDKKGNGTGTLILDATPNPVDEFGFPIINKAEPPLKLECTIKFVQRKKVLAEAPPGAPAFETEWQLYEITGPKIVSKLSLARQVGDEWSYVRFIWATKEGESHGDHAPGAAQGDSSAATAMSPGLFPDWNSCVGTGWYQGHRGHSSRRRGFNGQCGRQAQHE